MKNKPTNLSPLTPRLTNQCTQEKHPYVCQACGGSNKPTYGNGLMRESMGRWQECDHNDKPEPYNFIVLCTKCQRSVLDPHPRLYISISDNAPMPGCMAICIDCDFRDGIKCKHPAAKENGGTGVMLTIARPSHAMVDGRDYRGPITLWPAPASDCKQKRLNPTKR